MQNICRSTLYVHFISLKDLLQITEMFVSGTQNVDFYSNIRLGGFFTATNPIVLFSG